MNCAGGLIVQQRSADYVWSRNGSAVLAPVDVTRLLPLPGS